MNDITSEDIAVLHLLISNTEYIRRHGGATAISCKDLQRVRAVVDKLEADLNSRLVNREMVKNKKHKV